MPNVTDCEPATRKRSGCDVVVYDKGTEPETVHHSPPAMTSFTVRFITTADIATIIECESARCFCSADHEWRIACLEADIAAAEKNRAANWPAAVQLNCEAIKWHQQQLVAA